MCVRVGCYWLPFPRLIHTTTVWPLTLSMSLRLLSSSHSNVATAVIVRRAAMTSRAAAAATQFSLPKRLTLQSSFHLTLSRIVNIAQPPSIAPLSTSAASPSVVVLHCLRWRPVSPSLVPRLLLLLLLAVSMSVLLLLLLSPLHVSANRGQGELPTSPNTSSFVQTVWGGMPTATSVSPTGADGPFPSGVLSSSLGQHAFDVNTNNLFIVDTGSRICRPCWKRHKDHRMSLDGRIRVQPIAAPSPLDALLSAAISPLSPSLHSFPSPPSLASLSSPPPTPARIITPFPTSPIVASFPPQVQQQFNTSSTIVQIQSHLSASTVAQQSNTGRTVITSPRRTHSFPPVLDLVPAPATYSERQRDVVASVMAGIDYERYRLQQVMQGVTPMAKSTWYDHQSTVYNSIIQIAESKEVEYLQMLRATGQRVVLWSLLSYEANQCCWLLVLAQNKQIVLAVILTMHTMLTLDLDCDKTIFVLSWYRMP